MDSSDAIQVLILIALIGLSAYFSSSETALLTVSKIRIRNLIEDGNPQAVILGKVIEDQGKMLSAILIGNNIVNISASSLANDPHDQVAGRNRTCRCGSRHFYWCSHTDRTGIR